MESNYIEQLLSADNEARRSAELQLNNLKANAPANLVNYLLENMKSEKPEVAQLSCLMYKKMFLDDA